MQDDEEVWNGITGEEIESHPNDLTLVDVR